MKKYHSKSSNIILFLCIAIVSTGLMIQVGGIDTADAWDVHKVANDTVVATLSAPSDFAVALSEEESEEVEEVEIGLSNTSDRKELVALMNECKSTMNAAHDMAEAARALGYEESHEVISLAEQEYQQAKENYSLYKTKYDEVMVAWERRAEQYPTATYVWLYFDDLGYSNEVIAGILGNMMVECGGHTLSLQYSIYSADGYYGLCQWSSGYQSNMDGRSLEYQCEFLADTIQREFDTYGHLYKRGFSYSSFMSLTDEKEAAVAFARTYERCKFTSYGARRSCATTAYNYFVE